eukprot:CAMPEP_0181210640 /NCGR_PEP_ID=MMETSP1096-20121128/23347_1 /TAXON_ID=156174 ORGANISM="Chrysochromulina ericina, Strain CCMP281" /NCGR_SAMPLE_ID=MMETSP1096 /ASSEMBLY_ACC=CAM_ASM_000453 /LENGTH=102 /DNA_ID=CAMNT_0023301961 /DNA_START=43 /DNA_END=351 /DNA_ORIENTATION=+
MAKLTDGWSVTDVAFGVPLFDVELCETICSRMASCDTLSDLSLHKHQGEQALLLHELEAFISSHVTDDVTDHLAGHVTGCMHGGGSWPTRDLAFDGRVLDRM